jgi:signal transduction histidine kinase
LLDGAVALGRGDLNYRVRAPAGAGELAGLAREFNRMADRLAEQRLSTLREAEERLALERKLRHSEQLAAVGRLAAGVAHEMGAPLQVIDGRAKQLLHNADAPTETRQRNLIIIRNQADRIARTVRQLLNLSRPHKLDFRKVELTPLVEETAELIETQAESAGIEIALRCDDAVIEADPELIQQVLLNVFRNGIQAMPQGGRLCVECLKDAAEKGGRNFAALRVSDTGVGIAPESLPNIFDPFFTTKEVGQGTGLGLPISSRIVEEHDGWIEAANAAGGGAVFTVYLPQVGLAQAAMKEAAAPEVRKADVAKEEAA